MKIKTLSHIENKESSAFPIWLSEQIVKDTQYFKKTSALNEKEMETLSKWAYEIKPDLKGLSLLEAGKIASDWSNKKEASIMRTKIIKTANKTDEKMPDGDSMALYVQTLKQYLRDNPDIPEEYIALISNLPAARKVRQDFSLQECKVLYQTLEYLWERITKQRIIPEKEIFTAPESLSGNYWMLANGILLSGINHYTIAKHNSQMICSLLDIGGMTFQEYLGRKPNDLIKFIIKNGALRLFITKDKRLYCQCSPETYAKWARNKIRKLDFKKKVVKVIDSRVDFKGWTTGIPILL
jgi:hypothetical protein